MTDASSENDSIRVLVADDQELIRSGYKAILSTFPGIEVVGVAKNGQEAIDLALISKPDVVLMDVRMPEKDGIAATSEIANNPLLDNTHVLILTTFDIDEYVYDALSAGASGFLLKDADPDEIVHAIRVIARGEALVQPSVMKRLVEEFARSKPMSVSDNQARNEAMTLQLESLTDRELEILKSISTGMSNDEIAKELFISPATVKTHIARIMSKLSLHDRAQLVIFSYESGLVRPGSSRSSL